MAMFGKGGGDCEGRPQLAGQTQLSPEESRAVSYGDNFDVMMNKLTKKRTRRTISNGASLYESTVDQFQVFGNREQEHQVAMIMRFHPDEEMRRRAREAMVMHNQRWVLREAGSPRWRGRGVEYTDLVQAGQEGLLEAADKFDPERGITYITHAKWWVQQKMQRATEKDSATLFGARVPMEVYSDIARVRRSMKAFEARSENDPSIEALAKESKISAARANAALSIFLNRPMSMQQRLRSDDGDDMEFGNTLVDNNPSTETRVLNTDRRAAISNAFKSLDDEERMVMGATLGHGEWEEMSVREMEDTFGLKRSRINQLRKVGQEKLQKSLTEQGYGV